MRKQMERKKKMLSYNLDSLESAEKLVKMCQKYKGLMDIDIICGRYIIDAYSMLGVHSLIGRTVSIDPQTDREELILSLGKDLEQIKNEK